MKVARSVVLTGLVGLGGLAAAGLHVPAAFAQQPDVDPQTMCDASAAAFQAYALNNDDPDKDAATARVKEGVTDCKNGQPDQGLQKINEGTAMINDHEKTKMK